jgi:hypothetical protein
MGNREIGFDSRYEQEIFLFFRVPVLARGTNQRPIQWAAGPLSPGVNWPEHAVGHFPISSAQAKNA